MGPNFLQNAIELPERDSYPIYFARKHKSSINVLIIKIKRLEKKKKVIYFRNFR